MKSSLKKTRKPRYKKSALKCVFGLKSSRSTPKAPPYYLHARPRRRISWSSNLVEYHRHPEPHYKSPPLSEQYNLKKLLGKRNESEASEESEPYYSFPPLPDNDNESEKSEPKVKVPIIPPPLAKKFSR